MWIFLLWMCSLCVSPGCGDSDRACPRKDPPPGVVVISPGHELVLTCSGQVRVDGVQVNLTTRSSDAKRKASPVVTPASQQITSDVAASNQSGGNSVKATDGESEWEGGEMELEGDDGDEEGEEGRRVTRGVKSRPQWSWNRSAVGRDVDWGGSPFWTNGASLSLSPARLSDSGKYACHYRGRERFSVKVFVADPPENPSLLCYKKSPSSKIRCEWTPQKPVVKHTQCFLLVSKSTNMHPAFSHFPCSYSSQRARCWCALDYDDDELRILHVAYLCVTSITGSATSSLLHFTPLDILKPDPPSNVSVQQEEGHQFRMKVSWNLPSSWKQQDSHYALIYELRYRPVESSLEFEQVGGAEPRRPGVAPRRWTLYARLDFFTQIRTIESWRSYTITDAVPGAEYIVKLRAKDEFDGQWSEWSAPVYQRSWTDAVTVMDDSSTTVFDITDLVEDSDSGSGGELIVIAPEASQGPYFALWVVGLLAVLSVVLSTYMFRHRDRFLSKLHSVSVITWFGEVPPPPPAVTAAPEGQALVTFDPPNYKEENEGDAEETPDRVEGMHFNNASYFVLQTGLFK